MGFMRDRRDPWKWPCCIGVTVAAVLMTVFLLPQSWIAAFFSPLSLVERQERQEALRWMVILPPPPVEMVADLPEEILPPESEPDRTEPHRDPDWWSRGWRIQSVEKSAAVSSRAAAGADGLGTISSCRPLG